MKKAVFILLILFTFCAKADFMNADELMLKCAKVNLLYNGTHLNQNDTKDLLTCTGYIMGFIDNEIRSRFIISILAVKKEDIGKHAYCLDELMNGKKVVELAMMYTKYINEHPKDLSKSASIVLVDAMQDFYSEDINKCVNDLTQAQIKEKNKNKPI